VSYAVKEIFYTLQGEGRHTGRPAVFCRFAGCNLWSGLENDRKTAICQFCDTDFVGLDGPGGGRFHSAADLAAEVRKAWPHDGSNRVRPFVVCTGGEPLLQLDGQLLGALHEYGFEVAIETNGTKLPPPGVDWVCMSPKGRAELTLRRGDELKLIFPQRGAEPERFERLEFSHFFLQPLDGPDRAHNTALAIRYCLDHPWWRLSLQTHKYLGIP